MDIAPSVAQYCACNVLFLEIITADPLHKKLFFWDHFMGSWIHFWDATTVKAVEPGTSKKMYYEYYYEYYF